jgi:hypothetical protein
MQAQCEFEPGQVRCIFVESQPLGGHSLAYRIVDACTGTIDEGELPTSLLRAMQPWGEAAPAAAAEPQASPA